MYTLETLKEINVLYDHKHIISQNDVDIVNKFVSLIESTRNDNSPIIGDCLQYTDKNGTYYPAGHYESSDAYSMVCWGGSCANVYETPYNSIEIAFSGSGGPWGNIDLSKFNYVGKNKKKFWTWGTCGPTAHGDLYFSATVNVWRYDEPEQLHPGYSTEYWERKYLYRKDKTDPYGNILSGDGISFKTQEDYTNWLITYCAKELKGHHANQIIVYKYREYQHLISEEEYKILDLPVDTRKINASIIECKVEYNHTNKSINCYRCTNSGLHDSGLRPYLLARNGIVHQ